MRLLKNFRIKNKIIIIIVLIGAASTITGSVINYFYELHNTKEQLIKNSVLQAKLIAENCWLPLEFNYKKNATEALQKLHTIPEVQDATLYNLNDTVFASYSKSGNKHVLFPENIKTHDFYVDGDNLFIKQAVVHSDKLYGTIYLHTNINWSSIVTSRLLVSLLIVALMFLLIILFAFILQGSISQPIIELSHQMNMVAEKKDYSIQLRNSNQDEIGELYGEFNNMLAEINARQTDLKNAYTALETNEKWLSTVMEKTPLPIAMMNEDGFISFRNERFVKLFGYTQADSPTVADWFRLAYPDDKYRQLVIDTWNNSVQRAVENNDDIHPNEYIITCKDGRELNVLISGIMLNGALLVTFIDLTEIKKNEDKLQESQRKLTTLMGNMPGLAYRCMNDANWTMLFMSQGCHELTGYAPDEFEGNRVISYADIIHKVDADMVDNRVETALKTKSSWQIEYRISTKEGKEKWVWEQGCGVYKENGDLDVLEGFISDITERKIAEESLRKSEAIQNKMVSNIGDVIVIIDQYGINRYKSPNVTRLFGWKPEELVGNSTWDNVHPDDLDAAQNFVGTIFNQPNATGKTEIRYKRKSGEFVWIEVTLVNLLADPDIQGLLGNYHDITERKQAQLALTTSEERFRDLSNLLPQAIFETDITGKITYVNQIGYELFGVTLDDLNNGLSTFDMLIPEDRDFARSRMTEIISENKPMNYEYTALRKDGSTLPVIVYSNAIIQNNKPTGLRGLIFDISERKKAERELEKYSETLEELVDARTQELNYSLSQIKAAMNSTDNGILIVNREGHITLWNQKFVNLWHVPNELLTTEKKDPVLKYVTNQMAEPEAFLSKVLELYEHPEVISEDELNLADGRVFERYSQPQQIGDDIVGRVWSFRNITEQKQAEENLRKAKELAETANKAKSIFLANMTHEIRTPMNAVLGFAQLLERDTLLSNPSRSKVSTIIKSGEHLLGIINDILEVSRIEAGQIVLRNESVDLHNLLNDLAVMFRLQAEAKGLVFTLELSADLPRYIVADLGKLRQIIINLLGNAVKFTTKGAVVISAQSAGPDSVSIMVKDTGIGISPEERHMIFKPFERTRSGEQVAGGTGLGLVISREYAHTMGGEITFESTVNQGSTFKFAFHAPMTVVLPVSNEVTHRVVSLAPNQGEIRVLIVDDQATNRDLLRGILEPIGFIIDEAVSGAEAITKTKAFSPRIILMDMVMPDLNGIEATERIRLACTKESTTIIGISASAFDIDKQNFIDAGIDAFIAKPFREQELFDVIAGQANILFESEDIKQLINTDANKGIPTITKMPAEWRQSFTQAVAKGSITIIRELGNEASEIDPALATYIQERVALYDINGLKKLC